MADDVYISLGDQKAVRDAHRVRRVVFQTEQGISSTDDFDGKDMEAIQVIYVYLGKPVGTLRLREIKPNTWKLERMAVVSASRGKGIASTMMQKAITHIKSLKAHEVVLDAQQQAVGLYAKHGFCVEGDVFEEVGIAHVTMKLLL